MANTRNADVLLGSFAVLRTNLLASDQISSFIPHVCVVLVENNIKVIDLDELICLFEKRHGYCIPRMPMIAILRACTAKKVLQRESDGRFYVNEDNAKSQYSLNYSQKMTDSYRKIAISFQGYVKTKGFDFSYDVCENILISFFKENSSKALTLRLNGFTFSDKIKPRDATLLAAFVLQCHMNDSETFAKIREIAAGYLIASSIINSIETDDDSRQRRSKYSSLVLYLDTPFVLRVLGLNTDEMQVSYKALLSELRHHNNVFKVFRHTVDEIIGILNECERWIDDPRYNAKIASQALKTFISKKYKKADIQLIIEKIDSLLSEEHIDIDDTDYYSESFHYLQIDDVPIREAIIKAYSESNPSFSYANKQYTVECDIKSISSIFKLRRKKIYRDYTAAKFLFVTTNSTLAYISRVFTASQNPSYSYKVYPSITDVALGTAIWLSEPVQKIDAFSELKLLADCSMALFPSEEVIKAISDSIDEVYERKQITVEDYYLLRAHAFDSEITTKHILNDERAFSDKILEEILCDIKETIVAPYRQQVDDFKKLLGEKQVELDVKKEELDEIKRKVSEKEVRDIRRREESNRKALIRYRLVKGVFLPIVGALIAVIVTVITSAPSLDASVKFALAITLGVIGLAVVIIEVLMLASKKIKTALVKRYQKAILLKELSNDI